MRADLNPIIKIANQIKDKIDKVKQEDSVFGNEKKLFQMDLVNLNTQMDNIQEKISELRGQRYNLREDFYGKKCDYEIQLAFIKDIEWIKKIKEGVMEREERREIQNQERKEKREHWQRIKEERKQRDLEIAARNEERKRRE